MTRAWPAVPLLLLLLSLAISGSGIVVGSFVAPPGSKPVLQPSNITVAPNESELAPMLASWTADEVGGFQATILARSGFSPERSAFSRTPSSPQPEEPEYQPRLLGISGSGENTVALVEWMAGQPAVTVRVGDDTPWGIVSSIEMGRTSFSGGGIEQSISLYMPE